VIYFFIEKMEGYAFTDVIGYLVAGCFLLLFLYVYVFSYLRRSRAKKLKYEWIWIMKKTKVFAVREKYISWDEDSSWYYLYRLESKDETGNIYKSGDFKDAEHGWRTVEEMKKRYDGVVYDLADKDNAIRQINANIQRLEMELSNDPWFFKKMWLKKDIEAMKKYIEIVDEWPINPYLVCNGYKVSVWDSIDVFIDPENPGLYYFDLDFTKQK